jgi:hypothetical protein
LTANPYLKNLVLPSLILTMLIYILAYPIEIASHYLEFNKKNLYLLLTSIPAFLLSNSVTTLYDSQTFKTNKKTFALALLLSCISLNASPPFWFILIIIEPNKLYPLLQIASITISSILGTVIAKKIILFRFPETKELKLSLAILFAALFVVLLMLKSF